MFTIRAQTRTGGSVLKTICAGAMPACWTSRAAVNAANIPSCHAHHYHRHDGKRRYGKPRRKDTRHFGWCGRGARKMRQHAVTPSCVIPLNIPTAQTAIYANYRHTTCLSYRLMCATPMSPYGPPQIPMITHVSPPADTPWMPPCLYSQICRAEMGNKRQRIPR